MADKKISALTAATTPLAGTEVLPIVQSGSTVKVAVSDLTAGRSTSVGNLNVTTAATTATGSANITSSDPTLRMSVSGGTADKNTYEWRAIAAGAGFEYLQLRKINDARTVFTELLKIDNGGDLTVSLGNVVMGTSGKGIDFSANTHAAGMTSELLAYYEEGTFTATRTGFTEVLGGGTITSTGVYTRVGRVVTIQIILTCTGAATIAGNGGAGSYFSVPYAAGQNTPATWTNNTLFNASGSMVASGANLFVVTGWVASGNSRVFTATYSV